LLPYLLAADDSPRPRGGGLSFAASGRGWALQTQNFAGHPVAEAPGSNMSIAEKEMLIWT